MIARTLEGRLKYLSGKFPAISVIGPRQSGKTTLVRSAFSDYDYFNMENLNDRTAMEQDPLRILRSHVQSGIIIDEVQKVPELFSFLQVVCDESVKMGKFILTGSQNFLLLEKISQSLAGRVAICNLLPFDVAELKGAGLQSEYIDDKLFHGSYPALFDRGIPPLDYYPSYIQTYVERDVRDIMNIGNLSLFQRFLKTCAGRTGQLLNLSSLGNDLGITYKTVRSWISILEAGFILFLLPPYHRNYNKRLVKSPKIYFYDTGLLCTLLDIRSPQQLFSHYLRGGIFESYVISEYKKLRHHRGIPPAAYFWRDNAGHEVDLILEAGNGLLAVEIKSGETLNSEMFNGLRYFRKVSGLFEDRCFLIYGGDRNYSRKHGRVLGHGSIEELLIV